LFYNYLIFLFAVAAAMLPQMLFYMERHINDGKRLAIEKEHYRNQQKALSGNEGTCKIYGSGLGRAGWQENCKGSREGNKPIFYFAKEENSPRPRVIGGLSRPVFIL
jgi:hypothetical protein